MIFLLTDYEIINTIQLAKQDKDGFYRIDIPGDRLQLSSQSTRTPVLTFNESSNTVSCGKKCLRLSPLQFNILQYIYKNKNVGYEELQDNVWHESVSDDSIRKAISRLNTFLMDSDLAIELITRRSRVCIENVA